MKMEYWKKRRLKQTIIAWVALVVIWLLPGIALDELVRFMGRLF